MHKRSSMRWNIQKLTGHTTIHLCFLAFSFVVGSVTAIRFAEFCALDSGQALDQYLKDFCLVRMVQEPKISTIRTAVLYFFHAAAAFLLGSSSIGLILIPVLAAGFGFGTTFSVACFTAAFSYAGILPAMALLLPRTLVSLFCFLLVASEAMPRSVQLVALSAGCGKRCGMAVAGRSYMYRILVCAVVLFAGVLFDKIVTPALFRTAVDFVLNSVS